MDIKVTLTIEAGETLTRLVKTLIGSEVHKQTEMKFTDPEPKMYAVPTVEITTETEEVADEPEAEAPKPKAKRAIKAAKSEAEQEKSEAPTVTEIRALASSLAKGGKLTEVRKLISDNGGMHLNDVPEKNYVPFYEALKSLV